jgi:hypothetical protein
MTEPPADEFLVEEEVVFEEVPSEIFEFDEE